MALVRQCSTSAGLPRGKGRSVVHLGFGESRLPAFASLVEQLRAGAHRNAYGPVAGAPDALASLAGYFERRGLPGFAKLGA